MQKNIQLAHADHKPSGKRYPLSLVANDVYSPFNVGSLFRLCDALGIEKLYLCGTSIVPPNAKIKKASCSAEKNVAYEYHENAEKLITSLKTSGTFIVALELTSASIEISSDSLRQKIAAHKTVCLILGSELSGVNKNLLALSDMTTHIPMLGTNSSMNVVTAATIACFEITKTMQ